MQRSIELKHAREGDVPWQALREQAHRIKQFSIAHLDSLLEEFERQFTARGGTVLWARTADEGARLFLDVCRKHGATSVVKGKSMLSEELELNARLSAAGIEPVETDLGEYIVQLAGQRPSHIIGPALHLSRREIGELFSRKLAIPFDDDPSHLSEIARLRLRERFLKSAVGMTGANFAIAETGTVVVVENEGNGALSALAPPVHITVMGIEKVIPRLDDLVVFLHLLARAATGQKLSAYTHHFLGPITGRAAYCIIVDAGRTRLLADPGTRESLACIRCGACLNVCPIYRRAGGWAYGWVYPGPIGSVITPRMLGVDDAGELPFVSTLCGACADECPVKIALPNQLVHLRQTAVSAGVVSTPLERFGFALWSRAMRSAAGYSRFVAVARIGLRLAQRFRFIGSRLSAWTHTRALPEIARPTFKEWWDRR
jgi:L-lactate dehydrogenase complex protein LldF